MALEGLYIRVTHLSTVTGPILLTDIDSGFDQDSAASRAYRPGPVYVPAGGSVDLVYSSSVVHSYESGVIRQLVKSGHIRVTLLRGSIHTLSWLYSFAADGGTVSTKILKDVKAATLQIPSPIVVLRGYVEVVTALTSGGAATIAVGTTADDDGLLVATAVGSFTANAILPFNGALVHNGITTANAAHLRVAAATNLTLKVATAALTAGKAYVHLECVASLG